MSNHADLLDDVVRSAPVPLCDCGLAAAAGLIADRWTVLVLREAFYGVVRFDDMRTDLAAPKATLANRLRRLTEAGLLRKVPYEQAGQRTRDGYVLTEKGRSLALPLLALMQWGDDHLRDGRGPIALRADGHEGPVRVGFVDAVGRAVPPDAVTYALTVPSPERT